ncbi:unnamed protein product, partial [marine sediment metagenome]
LARELTEQTRIQSMTESIPRGEEVAGYCNGSLTWETHYLKPDYFLALFYDDTKEKTPDPYTKARTQRLSGVDIQIRQATQSVEFPGS